MFIKEKIKWTSEYLCFASCLMALEELEGLQVNLGPLFLIEKKNWLRKSLMSSQFWSLFWGRKWTTVSPWVSRGGCAEPSQQRQGMGKIHCGWSWGHCCYWLELLSIEFSALIVELCSLHWEWRVSTPDSALEVGTLSSLFLFSISCIHFYFYFNNQFLIGKCF